MATERRPASSTAVRLDAEHPWPGLLAYEEVSRGFFHGREDEAAELLRLIKMVPLTALYGKSGLGKSSLLQAGVFPLLRLNHYLPVYCRLDFSVRAIDGALEQIAQRLEEACVGVGAEFPSRNGGESLWEYLHRNDTAIWSKDNFPLTPVLVLDQFEELFSPSVGGADRVARVFDDLADLIENRIPSELTCDDSRARRARLDLLSQRYRIVLSFREDYLPEIKTWEKKVPSLLRNFLRLEPMTRAHAIEAVELAGKSVLQEGVAPAIVDFVSKLPATAQTTDHEGAIIEPVLLSLFCYQLNLRRHGAKIDATLVAGSGQDILDHFYRKALEADDVKGPPDVAVFIEDYLVQGDRYRGSYPKDEALEDRFLTPEQLDALTGPNHRLLRVVQHADTARIELIHDCLVPVVCKARDERKHREAQAELQRKATEAEARAREKEQYNQRLVTQRYWLGLAFVVALAALGGALVAGRLAQRAKQRATEYAATSERAKQRATEYAATSASYGAPTDELDLRTLLALQGLSLATALGDTAQMSRAADQVRRAWNSRLLWSFETGDKVSAVAFVPPDGRLLAAASGQRLRILDTATGKEVSLNNPIIHDKRITAITFAPDGTLIAGDDSGAVRLWDISTGDEKSPPEPIKHEPAISALASGPRNLLATGTGRNGSLALWDITTGKRLGLPFEQRDGQWFFDLSMSPDGSRLAAADVGAGMTTIWNVDDESPVALITLRNWRLELDPTDDPNGMQVNSIAFNRDGSLLATGDRYNTVNLWDGETGEHRGSAFVGHTAPVRKVAFNWSGTRLASAGEDKVAAVWDIATARQLLPLVGHKNEVLDVEFSPDGRHLATAGGKDQTVKLWNAEAHADAVNGVAFSADGKLLATASADRTIGIWDVRSRELVARLAGHKGPVERVAFSPDGRHLASASSDSMAIWDLSKGEPAMLSLRYRDPEKGYDKIYDVAYSPDGKWLATAGANFNAVVWNAADGQPKFARRHQGMVRAVAFSPDGQYLASVGDDGVMNLWDVSSGARVACAFGPSDANAPSNRRRVLDVNFSHDGNALVMATGQSSVYVVDGLPSKLTAPRGAAASGGVDQPCEGGIELKARELPLDESDIVSAQFTPDGKSIVTTGSKLQVAIWDADHGSKQDGVRVNPRARVKQVAFGRDELGTLWVATASDDATFHVSPMDTKELKDQTCERLGKSGRKTLTPQECEKYLGTADCPPPPCDDDRR